MEGLQGLALDVGLRFEVHLHIAWESAWKAGGHWIGFWFALHGMSWNAWIWIWVGFLIPDGMME
jgi:hypothetical protein